MDPSQKSADDMAREIIRLAEWHLPSEVLRQMLNNVALECGREALAARIIAELNKVSDSRLVGLGHEQRPAT